MNRERNSGGEVLQSNRHLKEWNDNLVREQQSKYALSNKHRQQRDQLRLHTDSEDERIVLRIQQADESQKLAHQQSDIRLTIQQRHQQEKLALQVAYAQAPFNKTSHRNRKQKIYLLPQTASD